MAIEPLERSEVTQQEILTQLVWSKWENKSTREGPRKFRYATINETVRGVFWASWKKRQNEWRVQGYVPMKWGDIWQVQQTLCMDGSVPKASLERAEQLKKEAVLSYKVIPSDWIPDDQILTTPQSKLLLHYQVAGVLRLKRALQGLPPPAGFEAPIYAGLNGNALDASDTGTGKTFCALVACAELGLTPCVIAPLAVLPSWVRAAVFLKVNLGWLINYDKLRAGRSGFGSFIPASMGPDGNDPMARGEFFKFQYLPGNGKHVVIFDEVQKCKAHDSKQGQILRDAARAGHKCLMLSATAAKDPLEMRNLGAALGLHSGKESDWRAWAKRNGCVDSQQRWGSQMRFDRKQSKANLAELHRQIFPMRGQRIRVADVPDFPETSITADSLDTGHTEEINQAYADAEAKIAAAVGKPAGAKAADSLAAMMAARIAAEKGKLDLFEDLAKEALDEGKSVAIFLNFRAHLGELAKRLKTECIIWGQDLNGRAQKPGERQQHIDDFNADRSRVILVSLQAGGAGLSLHDLNGDYPRVALISPSYSAIDLKQALGRVHRAGAKTKSMQRILFAAGTVEDEICTSMRVKLANIETLNDGDLTPGGIAEKIKAVRLTGEKPQGELP
jgi:hypothetical protein